MTRDEWKVPQATQQFKAAAAGLCISINDGVYQG